MPRIGAGVLFIVADRPVVVWKQVELMAQVQELQDSKARLSSPAGRFGADYR